MTALDFIWFLSVMGILGIAWGSLLNEIEYRLMRRRVWRNIEKEIRK